MTNWTKLDLFPIRYKTALSLWPAESAESYLIGYHAITVIRTSLFQWHSRNHLCFHLASTLCWPPGKLTQIKSSCTRKQLQFDCHPGEPLGHPTSTITGVSSKKPHRINGKQRKQETSLISWKGEFHATKQGNQIIPNHSKSVSKSGVAPGVLSPFHQLCWKRSQSHRLREHSLYPGGGGPLVLPSARLELQGTIYDESKLILPGNVPCFPMSQPD